ncbi:MAG: caspase family protein [Pyrinomonadaceae bacterium]
MKAIITAFVILLAALPAQPEQDRQLVQENSSGSPRRLALVIGNGAYENAPPLKNPPNDAIDIANVLSKVGFGVEHGVNLTQRQMKAMIREFGQKLRAGGQGLFYFAGHGVQLRGRNYLVPVDASIQSETDVEDQGVDTNLMLGMMDEAGNGLNVVILDACRNNPFSRSFRSASNGLAQMDAPSGTLIAYATAPGSVASDGNARNGLYTQELLKNMLIPGLSIEEVFKRVRISVRNTTAGKQTPWESSSLTGDFYFRRSNETANVPEPRIAPSATGRWSGSWVNTRGGTGNSTIRIVEEAGGVIKGDENGWIFQNGRRFGNVLSWEYRNQENGCRDYKVRLEISPDGQTASGDYQVTDRCEKQTYGGTYSNYTRH